MWLRSWGYFENKFFQKNCESNWFLLQNISYLFIYICIFLNLKFQQQAANESAMEEELGLVGASAEDAEAELIRNICETELLAGNGNFWSLVKLASDFCYRFWVSPPIFSSVRGEPTVYIPSPAGESLQLTWTLLPPTADHCCLSGSLSVYDDQVWPLPLFPSKIHDSSINDLSYTLQKI